MPSVKKICIVKAVFTSVVKMVNEFSVIFICGQQTVSTDKRTNDATASCSRQSMNALCLSFVVLKI